MELYEFIANVIHPRSTEKIADQNAGGKIEIGEGMPYFENQRQAREDMSKVYKEVASNLVKECRAELDREFYNYKALEQLTRPFETSDTGTTVKEQLDSAQLRVRKAFQRYELAENASSYVENNVR